MVEWARDNPWRQGHAVTVATARELRLAPQGDDREIAVVISHDCDLAQLSGIEPNVEMIVGQIVGEPDGNFTHAKNPRKLHLPFSTSTGDVVLELLATAKVVVSKAALLGATPRKDFGLTPERHSVLQRWLAARYRRGSFANAFEDRLDNTGLKDKLVRILKPLGEHIVAVFFDVDDGQEVDRIVANDTYTLDIYLLYSTDKDPSKAAAAAAEAKRKIDAACEAALYDKQKGWQFIELRACTVMSDEAMTYRQSCLFKKWPIDYLSLRDEPQQTTLEN